MTFSEWFESATKRMGYEGEMYFREPAKAAWDAATAAERERCARLI